MDPLTNAFETLTELSGRSNGSNPAEVERGAAALETLKEVFAANLVDCLEDQKNTETKLRTIAESGKVDRTSIIAMRTVHRCMLDRAKLLLGAIKIAGSLNYKRPTKKVLREA